tara:strand:+ start:184 stop:867 length:684 start_codon:yes stop_codon:yes gene_type:complete
MARPKSVNSKILVSGCGISYGKGETPTWINVLQICGLDIKDLTGPGITNSLILNLLISELHKNTYSHVICQLTQLGKLDVELNDKNRSLMENDSLRNYSFGNYWPSSFSTDHIAKKMFYDYLYSPGIEEQDLIIKILYLQELCRKKKIKLCIFQGTRIEWKDPLHKKLLLWKDFIMIENYEKHETYKFHDRPSPIITPNKFYQIYFAKKINQIFIKENIQTKLEKFK